MGKKIKSVQRKITFITPKGDKTVLKLPKLVKSKCCEKYKKGEKKRCGKCPCYDLFQQVA